jgi:RHS repeat-associated protein
VASTKTTIYAYNFLGKLQTLTLPDGRTYTYGYDDAHRLISITSNSGETITYTLDNLGNKTEEKITNSSGVVEKRLTQEFDALGNIAKSIESVQGVNAATTYTYDDMGNLSTETNPSGNVKTYTYDALSRLATAQEVLNGRNIINFYGYDATNQQTSAQAPNNAKTQYTYNGFGEVLTETSPDRGLVTYTYDSAGNVKTRKDARNKTLTYTYDALNRVLTSTDGTNTISYSYDLNPTGITCGKGLGRLCRVVDSSGVNDFVYNVLGQLTNKTSIVGTTTIPWLMSYDLNSKPIIIATGNRYIMHERDAAQRLLKVSTLIGGNEQYLLNNATYQADGNIKTLSYGNGETVTHTYDLSGHRLSTTRVGVGINDTFTWLTNGWLQKRVTTGTGGATRTYTYDSLGRLVSEAGTPLTQSFGYDDNGNRLSNGSNTYAYTANTNAMSKRQASAVTRDAAGNTLTDGTGRTLTWDSWGNLSSVTKAGITTSYVYNYRHQRVKKTLSNGTVTLYHYDESDRLIMETSGTGIVQAMYFYLDDNTPFALMYAANSPNNNTAQDQIIYLHTDHLGTPRLATDSTKKLIWRWESDAFGSTLANQDPDADGKATIVNLRFPGQYYDAESGLHYNWNRYYDPASGRYVSSDPIGLRGGRNTYGYVKQNPLLNFDLKGLSISTGDIIDGAKKGKGWWDNATDFAGIWSDLTTPDPNPPCGPGLSEEKGQQLLGGLGNLIGFVIGFFNPAQDAVDYGAPNGFFGTKPGLVANAGDKLSGRGRYIDGIVDSADPPIYHQ